MTTIAKWLRKASRLFSEKPEPKVDDFGLEHFLLYHGLAGSSPENQREFKDVRADILAAISRKNSQNLCINLKLAPLWWEDKLQRIFAEANGSSSEATLNCLLPDVSGGQEARELDPLMHEDWRVRANAATILAFLGTQQSLDQMQEHMIDSLNDTANSTSPAFCHIARSISVFRTTLAKEALAKHLLHAEPWIRVDSVSALAKWPLDDVSDLLHKAFAQHHDFMDYSAVAVARLHSPVDLLNSGDGKLIDLAAGILIGLLEASAGTFSSNSDLLPELSLQKCLTPLLSATQTTVTAVRLRALNQLTDWLDKNYHQYRLEATGYPQPEEIAEAKSALPGLTAKLDINAAVKSALAEPDAKVVHNTKVRHTIKLIGELKLEAAVPLLIELLNEGTVYGNEIIEALGLIGDKQCAPVLTKLARSLVNLQSRSQNSLSANPIQEDAPEKAKTYWFILRALSNLPGDETLTLLKEATQDEAPDKREEALSSLIRLWTNGHLTESAALKDILQKCLVDPSAPVRIKAMEGAAILNLPDLIGQVAKLINAPEMSVNRQAFSTLEKLAANGHKESIRTALAEAKQGQSNAIKVKRIDEFIQHHL